MSCNYAEGLSYYENKGKLGLPEKFDTPDETEKKVKIVSEWIRNSKHAVVHTGAGVSTSAGIPDFRGPNGVWTLEKEGKKPSINISWDEAVPTITHMALKSLQEAGFVKYIVTQNIDGLHLRSGFPRKKLAELHGNMFTDKCAMCNRQFVRYTAAKTVGQKSQGVRCPGRRANGNKCRGLLYDTILDWEHGLPEADLKLSDIHSCAADLSICLGTTLQIIPSGNLPVNTKKRGGKLVICNLQPTKQDRHADLIIHSYVDDIMVEILKELGVPLQHYKEEEDPVKITCAALRKLNFDEENSQPAQDWPNDFVPIDWSIENRWTTDKQLTDQAKSRKILKVNRSRSLNIIEEKATSLKRSTTKPLLDNHNKKQKVSGDVLKSQLFIGDSKNLPESDLHLPSFGHKDSNSTKSELMDQS